MRIRKLQGTLNISVLLMKKKQLRDYLLPRFPFLIVYRINAGTVEVIAVHHAKKDPAKKYRGTV
jgi:hypothetical protein